MSVPQDLKYTKTHEWIRIEADEAIIGITDFAQKEMGDIVFVELPEIGQNLQRGKECGVLESVKAASDIYAPFSGDVSRVNDQVQSDASLINRDPYGEGWFYALKINDPAALEDLLGSKEYTDFVEGGES